MLMWDGRNAPLRMSGAEGRVSCKDAPTSNLNEMLYMEISLITSVLQGKEYILTHN